MILTANFQNFCGFSKSQELKRIFSQNSQSNLTRRDTTKQQQGKVHTANETKPLNGRVSTTTPPTVATK